MHNAEAIPESSGNEVDVVAGVVARVVASIVAEAKAIVTPNCKILTR